MNGVQATALQLESPVVPDDIIRTAVTGKKIRSAANKFH